MRNAGPPTRPAGRIRRAALFGLLALLAASAWQWSAQRTEARRAEALRQADMTRQVEAGARLFDGREPLQGRIDGHADAMSASAVVCTNCHLPSARGSGVAAPAAASALAASPAATWPAAASPVAASPAAADSPAAVPSGTADVAQPVPLPGSIGPVLDTGDLTRLLARRGGPPSRFDEPAFCRLLRTGEDPAGVLLPKAMPRYTLDDAQCRQLWRHLTRDAS